MTSRAEREVPGIILPAHQVPTLFRAIERHDKAQGRYLLACTEFILDPSHEPAEYLRWRTSISVKASRSAIRAMLSTSLDPAETNTQILNFLADADMDRVLFLNDLASPDKEFLCLAEEMDNFSGWLSWQREATADTRDLEDEVVRVVSTILKDTNYTLAETLGLQFDQI